MIGDFDLCRHAKITVTTIDTAIVLDKIPIYFHLLFVLKLLTLHGILLLEFKYHFHKKSVFTFHIQFIQCS